jgi:hypothetical protein
VPSLLRTLRGRHLPGKPTSSPHQRTMHAPLY